MDDLIKGLVDVVLGGGHDGDRDRGNREEEEHSRNVPSGSSWAEVVSGDHDNDDQERRNNRWNRQAVHGGYEENEGRRRHDFNQNNWNSEEKKEEDNDGWETVGKEPSRRRHKVQKDQWLGYKRPPSEQQFSDEVDIGGSLEPSDEELANFKQACGKLWELDLNRLIPGKDYEIDCGEGKKVYQKEDMAGGSLFSWLSEDVFRKPTFSRFCSLLDNYNPNQSCKEVFTAEEKQEQAAFIEEICRTAPIKFLHKYLSSKNIVSRNYPDFKRTMTSLWFDLYGRGGTSGCSSAFEHVFVGEIKQHGDQEVSGFHNWLQPDSNTQLLTIQFEWNGILKSVSSTFVGVSPEFEIALYTLCFFLGEEDNHLQLGPYPVNIKCYRLGDRIGSVFPIAEC